MPTVVCDVTWRHPSHHHQHQATKARSLPSRSHLPPWIEPHMYISLPLSAYLSLSLLSFSSLTFSTFPALSPPLSIPVYSSACLPACLPRLSIRRFAPQINFASDIPSTNFAVGFSFTYKIGPECNVVLPTRVCLLVCVYLCVCTPGCFRLPFPLDSMSICLHMFSL